MIAQKECMMERWCKTKNQNKETATDVCYLGLAYLSDECVVHACIQEILHAFIID